MARSLQVKTGLSGSMSSSFEGHNVAYQYKGQTQSLTQSFNTNC